MRCRYLVGCDGAHSVVRKSLGLAFEGGRFDEQYMLADVCVDWSLPHELIVRSQHLDEEGQVDDLLVCIPLPGRGRYRMSMLVPPEFGGSNTEHGFASDRPSPTLAHIQAVLDRLVPQPVQAHDMRAGLRCSASATAWLHATRWAVSSCAATQPTFIRPPAPRA
jgi:2-polyprenyl-6-methoxyphenol hydroxylase-like FAD-dependent oxidoreductase